MSITLENRTYSLISMVTLPTALSQWTPDPLTVGFDCCEPELVCGKSSGDTWEKDKTSPFIKLFSATDTATFNLYKDGVLAGVQPDTSLFTNDTYSLYANQDWTITLENDGVGCYTLDIDWVIGGVSGNTFWGTYQLYEFSSTIVAGTVRMKSVFNSNQTISGINFTGSKVVDTFRFKGYFGDRQPQMEIDNIITNQRIVEKVTRENINKYTLETKDLLDAHISKITDFYLLSENEIYISDFNPNNPSNSYLDTPCSLVEAPEIEYFTNHKKAMLTATFNDKKLNNRSYY